jgi:hypothetical protein
MWRLYLHEHHSKIINSELSVERLHAGRIFPLSAAMQMGFAN